jgi:hypothetical protein
MSPQPGTSVLRLDPQFLSQLLFHGGRATVVDAVFDKDGKIELTIAGPDVPDAHEVRVVYVQSMNAGEIVTTAHFEVV